MVPFSVIVFGVLVWTIAVSKAGAKQLRLRFENGLVWTGPKNEATRAHLQENKRILKWRTFWSKVYGFLVL